jgi:hypothetical protein
MRLSKDLREFLELLNSRGVSCVCVGAVCPPQDLADLDTLLESWPRIPDRILLLGV